MRILNYYILVVSSYHSGIQMSTHVCPLHMLIMTFTDLTEIMDLTIFLHTRQVFSVMVGNKLMNGVLSHFCAHIG